MSQRVTKEILEYVQKHKDKGISNKDIASALRKAGWQETVIQEVVFGDASAKAQPQTPIQAPVTQTQQQQARSFHANQQQAQFQVQQPVNTNPAYVQQAQAMTLNNSRLDSVLSQVVQEKPQTNFQAQQTFQSTSQPSPYNSSQHQLPSSQPATATPAFSQPMGSMVQAAGGAVQMQAQKPKQKKSLFKGGFPKVKKTKKQTKKIESPINNPLAQMTPQQQAVSRVLQQKKEKRHLGWAILVWVIALVVPVGIMVGSFMSASFALVALLPALGMILAILTNVAIVSRAARAFDLSHATWRGLAVMELELVSFGILFALGFFLTGGALSFEILQSPAFIGLAIFALVLPVLIPVFWHKILFHTNWKKAWDMWVYRIGLGMIVFPLVLAGVLGIAGITGLSQSFNPSTIPFLQGIPFLNQSIYDADADAVAVEVMGDDMMQDEIIMNWTTSTGLTPEIWANALSQAPVGLEIPRAANLQDIQATEQAANIVIGEKLISEDIDAAEGIEEWEELTVYLSQSYSSQLGETIYEMRYPVVFNDPVIREEFVDKISTLNESERIVRTEVGSLLLDGMDAYSLVTVVFANSEKISLEPTLETQEEINLDDSMGGEMKQEVLN